MSEELICIDCGQPYDLTAGERDFYEQMMRKDPGFKMPKRCKECRLKKKEQRQQEKTGQRPYSPRERDNGRRFGHVDRDMAHDDMEIIKIHYTPAKPVESWAQIKLQAEDLKKFMDDNEATFAGRESFALHHCQVSEEPWNFFVANKKLLEKKMMQDQIIINPRIIENDGKLLRMLEGCMSFPHRKEKYVERYLKIKVEYQTPTLLGLKTVVVEPVWPISQMFQHEADHALGKNIYYEHA